MEEQREIQIQKIADILQRQSSPTTNSSRVLNRIKQSEYGEPRQLSFRSTKKKAHQPKNVPIKLHNFKVIGQNLNVDEIVVGNKPQESVSWDPKDAIEQKKLPHTPVETPSININKSSRRNLQKNKNSQEGEIQVVTVDTEYYKPLGAISQQLDLNKQPELSVQSYPINSDLLLSLQQQQQQLHQFNPAQLNPNLLPQIQQQQLQLEQQLKVQQLQQQLVLQQQQQVNNMPYQNTPDDIIRNVIDDQLIKQQLQQFDQANNYSPYVIQPGMNQQALVNDSSLKQINLPYIKPAQNQFINPNMPNQNISSKERQGNQSGRSKKSRNSSNSNRQQKDDDKLVKNRTKSNEVNLQQQEPNIYTQKQFQDQQQQILLQDQLQRQQQQQIEQQKELQQLQIKQLHNQLKQSSKKFQQQIQGFTQIPSQTKEEQELLQQNYQQLDQLAILIEIQGGKWFYEYDHDYNNNIIENNNNNQEQQLSKRSTKSKSSKSTNKTSRRDSDNLIDIYHLPFIHSPSPSVTHSSQRSINPSNSNQSNNNKSNNQYNHKQDTYLSLHLLCNGFRFESKQRIKAEKEFKMKGKYIVPFPQSSIHSPLSQLLQQVDQYVHVVLVGEERDKEINEMNQMNENEEIYENDQSINERESNIEQQQQTVEIRNENKNSDSQRYTDHYDQDNKFIKESKYLYYCEDRKQQQQQQQLYQQYYQPNNPSYFASTSSINIATSPQSIFPSQFLYSSPTLSQQYPQSYQYPNINNTPSINTIYNSSPNIANSPPQQSSTPFQHQNSYHQQNNVNNQQQSSPLIRKPKSIASQSQQQKLPQSSSQFNPFLIGVGKVKWTHSFITPVIIPIQIKYPFNKADLKGNEQYNNQIQLINQELEQEQEDEYDQQRENERKAKISNRNNKQQINNEQWEWGNKKNKKKNLDQINEQKQNQIKQLNDGLDNNNNINSNGVINRRNNNRTKGIIFIKVTILNYDYSAIHSIQQKQNITKYLPITSQSQSQSSRTSQSIYNHVQTRSNSQNNSPHHHTTHHSISLYHLHPQQSNRSQIRSHSHSHSQSPTPISDSRNDKQSKQQEKQKKQQQQQLSKYQSPVKQYLRIKEEQEKLNNGNNENDNKEDYQYKYSQLKGSNDFKQIIIIHSVSDDLNNDFNAKLSQDINADTIDSENKNKANVGSVGKQNKISKRRNSTDNRISKRNGSKQTIQFDQIQEFDQVDNHLAVEIEMCLQNQKIIEAKKVLDWNIDLLKTAKNWVNEVTIKQNQQFINIIESIKKDFEQQIEQEKQKQEKLDKQKWESKEWKYEKDRKQREKRWKEKNLLDKNQEFEQRKQFNERVDDEYQQQQQVGKLGEKYKHKQSPNKYEQELNETDKLQQQQLMQIKLYQEHQDLIDKQQQLLLQKENPLIFARFIPPIFAFSELYQAQEQENIKLNKKKLASVQYSDRSIKIKEKNAEKLSDIENEIEINKINQIKQELKIMNEQMIKEQEQERILIEKKQFADKHISQQEPQLLLQNPSLANSPQISQQISIPLPSTYIQQQNQIQQYPSSYYSQSQQIQQQIQQQKLNQQQFASPSFPHYQINPQPSLSYISKPNIPHFHNSPQNQQQQQQQQLQQQYLNMSPFSNQYPYPLSPPQTTTSLYTSQSSLHDLSLSKTNINPQYSSAQSQYNSPDIQSQSLYPYTPYQYSNSKQLQQSSIALSSSYPPLSISISQFPNNYSSIPSFMPISAFIQPIRCRFREMETPRQAARAIASLGREKKNNNNVNDINNLIQNYNYYNEQNNNDDYNEYNKINNLMDVDEKVDENKQDNFSLLQYQAQPFSDMHTILAVGSSSILDRSCLLCSLLLGFGLDAYVAYIVRLPPPSSFIIPEQQQQQQTIPSLQLSNQQQQQQLQQQKSIINSSQSPQLSPYSTTQKTLSDSYQQIQTQQQIQLKEQELQLNQLKPEILSYSPSNSQQLLQQYNENNKQLKKLKKSLLNKKEKEKLLLIQQRNKEMGIQSEFEYYIIDDDDNNNEIDGQILQSDDNYEVSNQRRRQQNKEQQQLNKEDDEGYEKDRAQIIINKQQRRKNEQKLIIINDNNNNINIDIIQKVDSSQSKSSSSPSKRNKSSSRRTNKSKSPRKSIEKKKMKQNDIENINNENNQMKYIQQAQIVDIVVITLYQEEVEVKEEQKETTENKKKSKQIEKSKDGKKIKNKKKDKKKRKQNHSTSTSSNSDSTSSSSSSSQLSSISIPSYESSSYALYHQVKKMKLKKKIEENDEFEQESLEEQSKLSQTQQLQQQIDQLKQQLLQQNQSPNEQKPNQVQQQQQQQQYIIRQGKKFTQRIKCFVWEPDSALCSQYEEYIQRKQYEEKQKNNKIDGEQEEEEQEGNEIRNEDKNEVSSSQSASSHISQLLQHSEWSSQLYISLLFNSHCIYANIQFPGTFPVISQQSSSSIYYSSQYQFSYILDKLYNQQQNKDIIDEINNQDEQEKDENDDLKKNNIKKIKDREKNKKNKHKHKNHSISSSSSSSISTSLSSSSSSSSSTLSLNSNSLSSSIDTTLDQYSDDEDDSLSSTQKKKLKKLRKKETKRKEKLKQKKKEKKIKKQIKEEKKQMKKKEKLEKKLLKLLLKQQKLSEKKMRREKGKQINNDQLIQKQQIQQNISIIPYLLIPPCFDLQNESNWMSLEIGTDIPGRSPPPPILPPIYPIHKVNSSFSAQTSLIPYQLQQQQQLDNQPNSNRSQFQPYFQQNYFNSQIRSPSPTNIHSFPHSISPIQNISLINSNPHLTQFEIKLQQQVSSLILAQRLLLCLPEIVFDTQLSALMYPSIQLLEQEYQSGVLLTQQRRDVQQIAERLLDPKIIFRAAPLLINSQPLTAKRIHRSINTNRQLQSIVNANDSLALGIAIRVYHFAEQERMSSCWVMIGAVCTRNGAINNKIINAKKNKKQQV